MASTSSFSSSTRYITLQSSDHTEFVVAESAAKLSGTLKPLIEGGSSSSPIPIFNVDGRILSMVIMYFEKHADESVTPEQLSTFDEKLVNVSMNDLYDLIQAASYLNVPSLLGLLSKKVASLIDGQSVMGIRQMLNIKNHGFTWEEEAVNLQKIAWLLRRD